MRPFTSGLPSLSFISRRSSSRVIFSLRIQFQRWYGASIAASSSIAPPVASISFRVKPSPCTIAASSGWWSRARNGWIPPQTTSPAAVPTNAMRSSDLVNSAIASGPYRRFIPAIGLSRFTSGIRDLLDQRRPPIPTGDRKLASRHTTTSGHSASSSWARLSPKWPNRAIGFWRRPGSGLSACFIQACALREMPPEKAMSASTPAPNTAAVASSRERGMLPCSRASRSRFSVGCSVFSPACSFSDIGARHGGGFLQVRARSVPFRFDAGQGGGRPRGRAVATSGGAGRLPAIARVTGEHRARRQIRSIPMATPALRGGQSWPQGRHRRGPCADTGSLLVTPPAGAAG